MKTYPSFLFCFCCSIRKKKREEKKEKERGEKGEREKKFPSLRDCVCVEGGRSSAPNSHPNFYASKRRNRLTFVN